MGVPRFSEIFIIANSVLWMGALGFEPDSWVSIPMGFEPDSWVSIPRVRTRLLGFRSRWGSNPTPGFRSVGFEPDSWVARGFDPGIPSDPEYRPQGVDPKGCGAEAPSSGVDPTEFWVLDP